MLNNRPFSHGHSCTHTAKATIEHMVQKGAEQLYDHYLVKKVPAHVQTIAEQEIATIIRPVHSSSHQAKDTTLPGETQREVYRIKVPEESKSTIRVEVSAINQ